MKNVFNVSVNDKGKVTLSGNIVFNKFESNVTKLNFTYPEEYTGYAYLLARSYEKRKEYFAIPVLDKSVSIGSTITQFDGPWAFNFAIMSDPIGSKGNEESIVFISDVFKGIVYDNIAGPETPNATEPNVIRICNDVKYLYDLFNLGRDEEEQKRQQAMENMDRAFNEDKVILDNIAASVADSESNAAESALNAFNSETHAYNSSKFAEQRAIEAMNYAKSAHADMEAAAEVADGVKNNTDRAEAAAVIAAASEAIILEKSADVDLKHSEVMENSVLVRSLTLGDTGSRPDEDKDNTRYYFEQTKRIAESIDNAFIPAGTISFSELMNLPKIPGYMYNIFDEFTSTAEFEDGGGIKYTPGTNVYCTKNLKWDCLAGVPILVDCILDTNSNNPISNSAVAKKFNKLSDLLDGLSDVAFSGDAEDIAFRNPRMQAKDVQEAIDETYALIGDTASELNDSLNSVDRKNIELSILGYNIPKECPIQNEVNGNTFIQKVGRLKTNTLRWSYNTSAAGHERFVGVLPTGWKKITDPNVATTAYLDGYTSVSANDIYMHRADPGFSSGDQYVYIYDSRYNTPTALNNALADKYVYYELATPVSMKIDNSSAVANIIGNDDAYSPEKAYSAGDKCIHKGALWKCLIACQNVEPIEGIYWEKISLSKLSEKISNLDLIEYIFGVGSNEFDGGSLSDYQNAGVFLVKNSRDYPSGVSNSGKLIVIKTTKTSNDFKTQIYFPNFSQPYVRYRYYASGTWTWSQWLRIGS